jgi:hypothetical protein
MRANGKAAGRAPGTPARDAFIHRIRRTEKTGRFERRLAGPVCPVYFARASGRSAAHVRRERDRPTQREDAAMHRDLRPRDEPVFADAVDAIFVQLQSTYSSTPLCS